MNKKIKFRGKDFATGEWLYGDLFQRVGHYPVIIESYCTDEGKVGYREVAVKENTVGQFTGLRDKNGKEIYERDIVKAKFKNSSEKETEHYKFEIKWQTETSAFFAVVTEDKLLESYEDSGVLMTCIEDIEVVGNNCDNQELHNILS